MKSFNLSSSECFCPDNTKISTMSAAYWSIDAILAEETKVKCSFPESLHGYGFLDVNHSSKLPKNTTVQLPFWSVLPLLQLGLVNVTIPPIFHQKVKDDLSASAISINLSHYCPYFFDFSSMILKIMDIDTDGSFSKLLLQAFRDRLVLINDYSQTDHVIVDSQFLNYLDQTELKLYRCGLNCTQKMTMWEKGEHSTLVSHLKRKRC
ncbi:hypothetical protein BC833DRAFT_290770 [Globomyces pollinis-pini]|nr:hypothetical protein BC833DRAFT_290770 [Globomyces pollinis-pini]